MHYNKPQNEHLVKASNILKGTTQKIKLVSD